MAITFLDEEPKGRKITFLDEETQEPVGTSIGQEISQLPAALKQSFGQPLEAIGETAQVAGFPAVGAALKGAIQEPEGYVSAGERFMAPKEGEFQIAGFAPQYAPRAIAEQTGQIIGSIGTRIAGAVAGGGLGALISPGAGVTGAAAGSFAGPALFEAAQIVGPVALERAKNNGYTEPTDEDMAYAVATAAGSGLLNAFGAKYLPGGEKAVGSFSKRLAASFLGEGIPEGLQSLVQQVGETVETKKGIQVSPKQAVGEALIGGGAGAAATIAAAPFTPEQIAEAKITESANKEAENLFIGNDNPQGKAVLANKQKLEQEIADAKQVLSAIESTDPIAQKLKLELKEKEAILAAAQGQVDSIVDSSDPVAEAEKQQIELGKAITAPAEVAPTEVTPVLKVQPKTREEIVSELEKREAGKDRLQELTSAGERLAEEGQILDDILGIAPDSKESEDLSNQEKITRLTPQQQIEYGKRLNELISQRLTIPTTPITEVTSAPTEVTPVTAPQVVEGLQAISENTATPAQLTELSQSGLVDIIKGEPVINEEGQAVLTQAEAPLPKLTPEERRAEIEAAPVAETPAVAPAPEVAPAIEEQVLSIVPPETLTEIDKIPNLSKYVRKNIPLQSLKAAYLNARKKTSKITNAEIKRVMDDGGIQTPLQIENTLRSLLEEKKGTTKRKELSQSEKNAIIEIIRNYTYNSFSEDKLRQELSKMRKERANLNKIFELAKKKGNTATAAEAMRKMRPLDDSIKRFNDARKEIDAIYATPAVSETITPAVEAAPVTPAPAEAPAITPVPVAETPAVATKPEVAPVQRDLTKPEQMTPEEAIDDALRKAEISPTETGFMAESDRGIVGSNAEEVHFFSVFSAIESLNPVSSEAVDAYGIQLPEGYTKQGDLYVYKPTTSEAVTPTTIKKGRVKPKLGEKGGVLIPSREDFIQAGQNIYEAGMEFGAWAKQMIQQFGDVVREFLGDVWQAVSGMPAKLNEVMGYLPKKGEAGELSFGKTGKLKRYTDKGTIVKLAITQEKDTPKGILSETIKIIKQRVFDGDSTPSESATKKAWGLIERLVVTNPDSINTAEAINQLTRETMQEVSVAEGATEGERQAFEAIKQTVGATKLNNELFKYAIKLAGQGDNSMLNYLLNNELNVVGTSVKSRADVGRTLGALEGLKSYIVQANEAEQAGFIQLAAQRFFNTTTPTEDQIAQIKKILTAVNETKVNEEEAILEELTQVGEKIGTELVENINTQIDKASKPEVKDPMVAAITAMLKLGGTFVYRKTKNKIKAAVEKTIKGGITNYRDKLVEGAANGLETGFWKTLSSQENKPGPLGELDSAQNRELGNIVKSTLVSMKLQGKPPNTKMSIYEQVASILGEKPLSQDKIKLADEKIRGEINSKRQSELEQTEDQDVKDAINLKYDQIENAWDMAMSQQLDMPVSDTMLRRLIFNELKESKTSVAKLATLMNEEPTIGASRQDKIVSSIINKIAGVTFEGQNPADYTTLKEYLSNQLESLIQEKQTEKKVVKTKEKVKANQAQTELDKLARIQSDTPNFPTSEKVANPVKDAVRNALKLVLNPMFDPKAAADIMRNWKKSFAAELQQLGVDETTALTLTDVVGRQIELDSVSKNLDTIDNAINKGALSGVINAIKNTPLADQQKPNWRYEVMRDYLRSAGLPMAQAEKIAKLMDISLQKRFAKAQEEAAASIAKTILKGVKPESNRGFVALIQAIRVQVLNPGSNVAMEFGRAMGWKGFTPEQLKALNEFDSKINDETITDAERAVALEGIKKIIDKVSLPTRVRDSLSAFYIGQALGRLPVATVQVIDPAIFAGWDAAVAAAKNITSPELAMQIWGNYISSLINAGREFAFSFKNDVTRSGRLVDYLETQDRKLKRLRNDANNLWKNGQYKQAIKKYLFSYPEITSRVLKALDDASNSLLQQNALNQYMISAMNMAKIPKKDQLGALRQIAQARQMDIADMRANGINKNDAIIYANERMKAEISRVMSGLNLNSSEIIDSAINDSLSRLGKTRFKEQFSGEAEFKDEGTLSYPFLKTYELTSQAVSGVKGKRGEVMRIFQRILFGFPVIVTRVANIAYGYTPFTIYRHAMQKYVGNYPLTYGTAMQRRKRWAEQLAGTAVLLPLLFLRSMSFDDDDDKKPISIVFTGFGPVRSKDPEAYNQWHKKHNPGSLEIFIYGKRYALDSKSAGPLKPMIEILGAIDDWQIRKFQDGAKLTKEEMKKAEDNAGLIGTLGEIAGSFFLTAARRGPATGLMQGLIDFRRYPDDPLAAIAQEASFSFTPLIPVVGFGATKNISDALSEPIDTRTKEGAILNNLPIVGPMFGKPAINAFGQPIGDVQISEKIKKVTGIPVTFVSVSSGDDAKLSKITLKNANGPEPLQRNWFDAKFETPLSDQEWRTVNEDYARSNRKLVLENYEELNGFEPEVYKIAISNVGTSSKYLALDNLYKARKKP